jgi:hypothetical protein
MFTSLVLSKLTPEDRGRAQLISAFTTYTGHATDADSFKVAPHNIIEVMKEKPARLYVLPVCRV